MADLKSTSNGAGGDVFGIHHANLADILDAKLDQLGYKAKVDSAFSNMNIQLKTQEEKAEEIDKIFEECEEQLRKMREELDKESDVEPELVDSGSDSGDDVQFIETTYTPPALKQPMTLQQMTPILAQPPANGQPPPPPSAHMIMRATSPGGALQPAVRMGGGFTPFSPRVMTMPHTSQALAGLRPHGTYQAPQMPKPLDLAVGMKLFGKKSNDIWYKGTLVEIQNKDKPVNEKKYKLKFDCKGMKVLSGMHLAYCDEPTTVLPVGSRVIAMYKEEDSTTKAFYAGIVAESPSVRNNQRYLVFFDDGYAQYGVFTEIRKVYEQSKNVWEDIHPDSQEFIKSYLKQYPERPMVRLQKGQVVKTEWNGKWWTAKVEEVDASLVKMYFDADNRNEWIYRGSTRLEPLYTELANAEASKVSGKGRRHNVNMKSNRKPYVEYTRGHEEEVQRTRPGQPHIAEQQYPNMMKLIGTVAQGTTPASGAGVQLFPRAPTPAYGNAPIQHAQPVTPPADCKKRSVARKSTAMRSEPEKHIVWHKLPEPVAPQTESDKRKGPLGNAGLNRTSSGKDIASLLQNRLSSSEYTDVDEEAQGERMEINRNVSVENYKPKTYKRHRCNRDCISKENDDPAKWLGCNPLIIPMKSGWERQIAKQKNTGKRVVFYRTPCARRLRSMDEVDGFLCLTNSHLTVDLFSYDPNLHTHSEFVPIKTFCDIKDLSYGKETVPISCVNGFDRQYPDYVEYSNQRIPAKGVTLNLDPAFLCGCDCTDGCRDPNKCACIQRTIEASKMGVQGYEKHSGYDHRRLLEPLISGIYECNPQCGCDKRCANRVAQNPLQLRLQVFKTEKRGWGLRCLDDIPKGGFICIYAGQLLTEQGANEDGQQYGDEYLAELDYIEVVEGAKEGYESDVDPNIDEGIGEEGDSEEEEFDEQDTDRNKQKSQQSSQSTEEHLKLVLKRQGMVSGRDESWSVKVRTMTSQKKTEDWVRQIEFPPAMSSAIVISDSDEETTDVQQDQSLPQVDGAGDSKSDEEAEKGETGTSEEQPMEQDVPNQENPEDEGIAKEEDVTENMAVDQGEKAGSEEEATTMEALAMKRDFLATSKSKAAILSAVDIPGLDLSRQLCRIPRIKGRRVPTPQSDEEEASPKTPQTPEKPEDGIATLMITEPTSLNVDDIISDESDEDEALAARVAAAVAAVDTVEIPEDAPIPAGDTSTTTTAKYKRTTRSQTQTSRFHNLPDPKEKKTITVEHEKEKKKPPKVIERPIQTTREMFGEEYCYCMDAKSMGNLGRYLNHSCAPNVFVQNVFVDTHDLRFPWVAFFASQFIRAGTELTWDYNYEVGSVPGKVLYCYCGAAECRGRLL